MSIKLNGEVRVAAPRADVWRALNDPAILRQAIPGCKGMVAMSATEFTATVDIRIGPVTATLAGQVILSDLDPPIGCTIAGQGQGAAGFAKAAGKVRLGEDQGATILTYEIEATVGGKLAQLGARLIEASARQVIDQFFVALKPLLDRPAVTVAASAPPPAIELPRGPGLPMAVWVGGVVILVGVLLAIVGRG